MTRWLLALIVCASLAAAQDVADRVAPEPETPLSVRALSGAVKASQTAKAAGQPVKAQNWMVVAANPYAVQAGADILAQGGTAADAMVAVQSVLGLVEPQSSGLGGGAFLLWYDAQNGALTSLDGRETAPLAATPRLFQTPQGEPLTFFDAVIGGRSVGVPGVPALMQEAHRRWGRLGWAQLFERPIALSEEGFIVSARMATMVRADAERLGRDADTAAYFLPDGRPVAEGIRLQNTAYAQTLRTLAGKGARAFYMGPIGKEIIAKVQGYEPNPGLLELPDMALYKVKERPPVCAAYRGYEICGMGPPSSGGISVGQITGALNGYTLPAPDTAEAWRLLGDATRLAFADRGRYIADQDFVPVPVKGLLAPEYLAARGALLQGPSALQEVTAGAPEFDHSLLRAEDDALERPSTTHISIVDQYGNALSMTSSVENAFGSRLMAAGFLLNNQLTDFSFRSHRGGVPVANRVAPGKRPRSSMAPTIVLKDGAPVVVLGSPGGSRIIPYVAGALVAHLDWGMDAQAAVSLPHLVNRFGRYDLEQGTAAEELADPLRALGYEVSLRPLNSGLHMITLGPDGLSGGADPRREGIALGR